MGQIPEIYAHISLIQSEFSSIVYRVFIKYCVFFQCLLPLPLPRLVLVVQKITSDCTLALRLEFWRSRTAMKAREGLLWILKKNNFSWTPCIITNYHIHMCSSSISLSLLIYLSISLTHTYNTHIDSLSLFPPSLTRLLVPVDGERRVVGQGAGQRQGKGQSSFYPHRVGKVRSIKFKFNCP